MARKLTTEEFKEKMYNIYGEDRTLLSEYKGNKIKVKIRCNLCSYVYFS